MSVEALRIVRAIREVAPGKAMASTQKLVLYALADMANDEALECWPSMAALIDATCLSERAIQGTMRGLEALGLVTIRRGVRSTPIYCLNLRPPAPRAPRTTCTPQEMHPALGAPPQDVRPAVSAGGDAPPAPQPPQDVRLPPAPPAPGSLSEAKEEASRKPRAEIGHRLPDDWAPSRAGVEFATGLGLDWQRVAAAFCDHWHAKAGKDARKVDWDATWRNWCRTDSQRRGRAPPGQFAGRPTNLSLHLTPEPT